MTETDLLNSVRLRLTELGCKTFRINVGCGYTSNGNFFRTGVPVGFSDLLVVRWDGKACFIETKLHPRKPTKAQCNFILQMISQNAPAGVAYTVEDAVNIINWENDFPQKMIEQIKGYYK